MKRVRARERVKRRLADQTTSRGKEQMYRPRKSPMLKMKKCIALKSKGCVAGFVGRIEMVIGGNTDCRVKVSRHSTDKKINTNQSHYEHIRNSELVDDVRLPNTDELMSLRFDMVCNLLRAGQSMLGSDMELLHQCLVDRKPCKHNLCTSAEYEEHRG